MGVGRALIAGAGDDVGDVGLVGHIIAAAAVLANQVYCMWKIITNLHGEGVLIVAIANVTALVTLIGAMVDQALSIVDIAVIGGTSEAHKVLWVANVEEVEAGLAKGVSARLATHGGKVAQLLVHYNVVGTTEGQQVPGPGGQVILGKSDGLLRVNLEQLAQVKHLDTVVNGLGADDNVALICADLTPLRADRVILGETTEVGHLAIFANLDKGCTLVLANSNKLATVIRSPTPRGRALADRVAELVVGEEVVKVNIVAAESVAAVAGDGLDPAIDALGGAELRVLGAVKNASFLGLFPIGLISRRTVSEYSLTGMLLSLTFLFAMIWLCMTPESYNSSATRAFGSTSLDRAAEAKRPTELRRVEVRTIMGN